MEVLVIGAVFFSIIAGGAVLAGVLTAQAPRADQRYLNQVEEHVDTVTSEPAWVQPRRFSDIGVGSGGASHSLVRSAFLLSGPTRSGPVE